MQRVSTCMFSISTSTTILVPGGNQQTADLYSSNPNHYTHTHRRFWLTIPIFLLFTSISYSHGAALLSDLMDLRWCMHFNPRIPSRRQRAASKKKMTCGTKRHGWIDQNRHSGDGRVTQRGTERMRKNRTHSLKKVMCKKKKRSNVNKASKAVRTFTR